MLILLSTLSYKLCTATSVVGLGDLTHSMHATETLNMAYKPDWHSYQIIITELDIFHIPTIKSHP